MNAGLKPGSTEWVRAIQSHYTLDPDIHMLCELYIARSKQAELLKEGLKTEEAKVRNLNVLAAHITELSEQMARATGTMSDMTKEKVDHHGEG